MLAAGLVAPALAVLAQEAARPFPSGILLNGITSIPGGQQALFKVTFAGGIPDANFRLAQGQARYGIQLLAVDRRLNAVTICSRGETRSLSICSAPTLLALTPPAAAGAGTAGWRAGNYSNSSTATTDDRSAAGKASQPAAAGAFTPAVYAGLPPGGPPNNLPGGNGNGLDNPGNGAASSNVSAADGSAGILDQATAGYHWWIKEAQKVEQARLATAQQVSSGAMAPFPLTPLTPPGTAPQLIGPGTEFFYFDPLAAND